MIIKCKCDKSLTDDLEETSPEKGITILLDSEEYIIDNEVKTEIIESERFVTKGIFYFKPEEFLIVHDESLYYDEEMPTLTMDFLTKLGTLVNLKVDKIPEGFVVSADSVIPEIIPEWHGEGGCCNWSNLRIDCECGNVLGLLQLDCYQKYSVTFFRENTELVNS